MIEKGLRWDTETIDLSRLEQRNPAYLEINPNGFVPTLAHGERVIYESNVITEYLDDVFPKVPLYPADPWELAQVKMWQSAEAAMAKDYRTLMYHRLMGPVLRLTRSLEEALAIARRSTSDPADLAWEQNLSIEGDTYRFTAKPLRGEATFRPINTNGSQRGWRPLVHYLSHRVRNVEVIEGAELGPRITDDFLLVPNPRECNPNRTYQVVFRAEPQP